MLATNSLLDPSPQRRPIVGIVDARGGQNPLQQMVNAVQDAMFEGLTELLYARGYLAAAAEHDDRETEIERRVFARMGRCGCACCRLNLDDLIIADAYDHQERLEGHALALVRQEDAGAYFRGGSTLAESARQLAFGRRKS